MLTSKLYGDTDARIAISVDVVGLSYDSSTGVVSLADGYAIPTTTKTGQWDAAYAWGDHSTAGYLPSATAATTYAPIDKGVTGGDTHDHNGGDGAQIDHGGLGGLADDDHTQYHTAARADTWIAAQKAVANGLATLDAGGKIPVAQLPASVMQYKGTWNASTNTPTLVDGTGDTGDIYRVTAAGSQDLGSGVLSFEVGDYAIYNGASWEKSDTTDAVASVNGLTGVVSLDTDDIDEGSTNEYFTDARAQAALAGMYDPDGTAASAVSSHESTYDHSLIATAVQSETDPVVGAITGIVKADGAGNISAATAGTDYLNASSQVVHSQTSGYAANEHIDWTAATQTLSVTVASGYAAIFMGGYVGIGTSKPTAPLHIVGPGFRVENNTEFGVSFYLKNTSTNGHEWRFDSYGDGSFRITDATAGVARVLVTASGDVGFGTGSPTAKIDAVGDMVRIRTAKTPANATATGNQGTVCWDESYIYVCTATNTWKRAAIATW